MDFQGKNVVVTGGAQGIGRAVAEGVVQGGGNAIVVDINLESATKTCRELGEGAKAYKMDLGDAGEIRRVMAQIIGDYGKLDAVVNNAGIVSTKPFEDVDQDEWEKVIRINLTGTYTVISAVFPHMRENGGGRIVNVASVAAKIGGGLLGTSAYAASKAGVIGLTKAVAKEGGRHNICCNAVCPSWTETAMTAKLDEDKEKGARALAAIPLGRRAQPREIANMVLFFASDLASFVTGEIGDVDGGVTMDG